MPASATMDIEIKERRHFSVPKKIKRKNLFPNFFSRMKCCGVNSFEDWKSSAWWELPERRNNKVKLK